MTINAAGKAAVILIFFSLFSACGELDMLVPSTTGSYQVRALVNGSSLESCSVLRSNDKIRPYFAVSVINDPDLVGLLVYFENSQGEVVGGKVRYILQSHADGANSTEPEVIEEKTKTDKIDEKAPEKTTTEKITHETEKTEKVEKTEKTEENELKEQKVEELPEQETVKETLPIADAKPVVKNTDVNIVVKSFSEELPYLPLPKKMEIGSYTLVFKAVGVKETLSHTEINIFYLDNAEFQLKDISMYLPSQSGSQLIAPETTVMLEARLDFDKRLDPYVIWYNGKNIMSEGKISSGAGTILWKAPEQAGFYSLRMEAFPLQLKRNNYIGISREITLPVSPKAGNPGYFFTNNREYTARSPLAAGTAYPEQVRLITAISSSEKTDKTKDKEKSAPALPPVPPSPPELLRWYQFEGSLHNSTSPLTNTQSLTPVNIKAPRWAAVGQSYGLSTGSDHSYTLSPINFFRNEDEQGGGIFLFHIMPATEGAIFSAFFPLQSSSTNGVWMYMTRERNSITLRLSAENTIVEIPVYLTFPESRDFIPIVVEFYIRPYRLEAKLSLGAEYSLENKIGNIKLPGALSGEGKIRLGGSIDKSMLTAETDSAKKDADITAVSKTLPQMVIQNTIWDEFAILLSTVPLLQEEVLTEIAAEEQDAAETKTVETKAAETKAAEQKDEKPVPAVQYETETITAAVTTAAADYDYKPETVSEATVIEIPLPDTDETTTSPTTSN